MRFVGERDSASGSFKDNGTISLDPAAFLTNLLTIGLVVIIGICYCNESYKLQKLVSPIGFVYLSTINDDILP